MCAEIIHTGNPDEAFHDCDCAILVRGRASTIEAANTRARARAPGIQVHV